MSERLYAEPEKCIVDWNGEIFERWVSEKKLEDVEHVVAIVSESVRVNDGVEMYGD